MIPFHVANLLPPFSQARDYIHRVGRTARAGRRGLAVTLVGEEDVGLVHAAEKLAGREMEKNEDIKDRDVLKLMSSVAKASRLTKVKLDEVGFGKLVKKRKGRKEKERKARQKVLRQAGLK
jgi:ATP-dependent RNA helicase DDX49/DBP8